MPRPAVRARSGRCPCSRRPARPGVLHAGLAPRRHRVPARVSETCDAPWLLARRAHGRPPGSGAGQSRLGTLGKFPRSRRSGRGRSRPAEPARGGEGRRRVPQPGRPGPGSREQAQLLSLCLAQRSGRPVPRRPLRAQLPLSMPGAGRCPARAPPARGLCSPSARPGPGPRAVPGGGAGSWSERASEPGNRRPTSPASSAQLAALPALLPAPRPPPLLKGQCSLGARPGAGPGGGTIAGGFWIAGADRRLFHSFQKTGVLSSPPPSLQSLLLGSEVDPHSDPQ